jgi:hypothetical protein
MIGPAIPAGMKQTHDFAALAMDRGDIGSFTSITKNTCVSQVFADGLAPVLAADDVIDLVAEPGIGFVDPAVFATLLRPPCDFVAKRLVNVTSHG